MLFFNTHQENKRYIFLDLTGPKGWEQSTSFVKTIKTLAEKHYVAFMITDNKPYSELEKISLQVRNTGNPSDVWLSIYGDLDIDQTQIIIMTNNKENIPAYVQEVTSVVYLQTKNCDLQLDIKNMPDLIWDEADFASFVKTNRLPQSYLAERFGFENIEQSKVPLLKLSKGLDIPGTSYEADLMFTGRYFTVRDQRFYSHPLSRLLISYKNNFYFYPAVAKRLIGYLINAFIRQNPAVQEVTFVPPRPGKSSRFKGIERHVKKGVSVSFDTLFVKENYASPSNYRTFRAKHRQVAGKIGARNNVSGHVLLVDDVFTSGATTAECAKQLYENGAEKVTILPLAYTQEFDYDNQPTLPSVFDDDGNEYNIGFHFKDDRAQWYVFDENKKPKSYKKYEEIKEAYLANHGWGGLQKNQGKTFTFGDKYQAIIFDLDNTLLFTDHLEEYRRKNKKITDHSLIEPKHIIIGSRIVRLLRSAGYKIGIVTSSPRNYASSLLSVLGYDYDSLVANKDTLKAKPSPDPLIKCAKQLKVEPESILNIGDQPGDLAAGKWCGMLNIHIEKLQSSNLFSYMIEQAIAEYVGNMVLEP